MDLNKLITFIGRWKYQQIVYSKLIFGSFRSFISHFPMGYVNFISQLILSIVSIPILLGNALEFFLHTILIIKPTIEDVGNILDDDARRAVTQAQVRAINDYKALFGFIAGIITGIVGVIATLFLEDILKLFR